MLTADQIADYERDGFLVLRGLIPEQDIDRLERGLERNPPLDGDVSQGADYPKPGRYTLALNSWADPDLAFLAEHDRVLPVVSGLLGEDPRLTAYVIYDRTPGGNALGAHNDYKRWRPVGSSMNWLFTIVPFCDFDAAAGELFVAPGSHRLERIHDSPERPLCVDPAIRPDESAYIDTELRRGDLCLMNMHLWHKASGNTSNHHRVGAFNKYAAADAPPAVGYFMFDDEIHATLSPEGRSILAVHSSKPVETTRLVLLRERKGTPEVLLLRDDDRKWHLPGGPTWVEGAIPDWDIGNYIASLQTSLRDTLKIETPWVSYVGDYDEGDHLCRVYGYTLNGQGFPVPYREGEWVPTDELESRQDDLAFGYERDAADGWLDPTPVRGKGITQAQARVDQYSY